MKLRNESEKPRREALREKLAGIFRERDQDQKKLLRVDEISSLQSELEAVERQELQEQKKLWTERLDEMAKEARAILDEIGELCGARFEYVGQVPNLGGRIGALKDRLLGICDEAENKVPKILVQVSSKSPPVLMEKEVKAPKDTFPLVDLKVLADPDPAITWPIEYEMKIVTEVVPPLIKNIELMKSLGYKLAEGQKMPVPEELKLGKNAELRLLVPLPGVLDRRDVVFRVRVSV